MAEESAAVRGRPRPARAVQRERLAPAGLICNAEMGPAYLRAACPLDTASEALLRAATRQLQLSARAYDRVIKLARTIADLAGAEQIGVHHVAEALQFRPRERSA